MLHIFMCSTSVSEIDSSDLRKLAVAHLWRPQLNAGTLKTMAFLFVALLNVAAVVLGVRVARTHDARSVQPFRALAKLLLVVCFPLGLIGIVNAFLNDELRGLVDRYLLLAATALPILVACAVLLCRRAADSVSVTQSEQPVPPPR
jgi:hypothetical protein